MSNWIDVEIIPPREKTFILCKTCETLAEYIENRCNKKKYKWGVNIDDKFPIIAYKIRNSENSFYTLGNYSIK